jgi:hypothetical protein
MWDKDIIPKEIKMSQDHRGIYLKVRRYWKVYIYFGYRKMTMFSGQHLAMFHLQQASITGRSLQTLDQSMNSRLEWPNATLIKKLLSVTMSMDGHSLELDSWGTTLTLRVQSMGRHSRDKECWEYSWIWIKGHWHLHWKDNTLELHLMMKSWSRDLSILRCRCYIMLDVR